MLNRLDLPGDIVLSEADALQEMMQARRNLKAKPEQRTCYAHDREEYNCRQCDQRQDGRFTAYLAEPQQQQQEEENAMQDAGIIPAGPSGRQSNNRSRH